jgi:hypothetical protein
VPRLIGQPLTRTAVAILHKTLRLLGETEDMPRRHDQRPICDLIEGVTSTPQLAPDVSAVVLSHDGYADLWPAFFELLFRFWPDLPYPLHLVSNRRTFPHDRVIPVRVGDDRSWSETLARALDHIPGRYVLLMLEDYFLTGPVDTASLTRLHAAMVKLGAVYLRLVPAPKPDSPCPGFSDIGYINKGAPYRASLQVAFWERSALLGLLREDETAWDFELKGSRRSDQISYPFLSVYDARALQYRHAVRRGRWIPHAIRQFAALGITFDPMNRPTESELYACWEESAARRFLGKAWRFVTRRKL